MCQVLRVKDVTKATKLSRSTIYAYIAAGRFPAPVNIGIRAVGWDKKIIENWLASRQTGNYVIH